MGKKTLGFAQMRELLSCAQIASAYGEVREEAWIEDRQQRFPLISLEFGPKDLRAPTLIFVGGVHGLEQIGSDVILAYLRTFLRLLKWDELTQALISSCRLVFYPIANPVGMQRSTRCNGRGVDLMRNGVTEAHQSHLPLVAGHRLSPRLPWFRGWPGELESETQALMTMVRRYTSQADFTLSLDVHSGFGIKDRLWFPYAHSNSVFPDSHLLLRLKRNLDRTYPNHIYTIEPQSASYTTHGDLWDDLYLSHRKLQSERTFLPLSLEMGSWHWIRKNPKQVLSAFGIFNPILPHRFKRIQRRHLPLFDFLLRSVYSAPGWLMMSPDRARKAQEDARLLWYPDEA